ncbi:unnamed protein product [Rotaria magnacalcarata]|uniref:Uncharacterized protein n=1 Tax=Rotaria magnacalcarata TaxID=392030 RepID=A0A816XY70_9BILA|nr:unnamed protein product [Rotaria magnacalcarata]CAF3934605.1 unnamed protein product [Rotaria magnacalcarata]
MKWLKDTKKGIIVAGSRGEEDDHTKLSHPNGFFMDTLGTVYVADAGNQRVIRWLKRTIFETMIISENGAGRQVNQLNWPISILFDLYNHLYAAKFSNNRVQGFSIDASSLLMNIEIAVI